MGQGRQFRPSDRDLTEPVGYRRLTVWRKAHELASMVYRATKAMGREDYWLQLQIRRAAFSVPCNIVEGYSRRSRKEYLQFLNVAKASLAEVEYQLFFMAEEGIADGQSLPQIDCLRSDTPALLHNLMKSLEKGPDRDGRFVREIGSEYLPRNEATPDPMTPDP